MGRWPSKMSTWLIFGSLAKMGTYSREMYLRNVWVWKGCRRHGRGSSGRQNEGLRGYRCRVSDSGWVRKFDRGAVVSDI